MEWSGVEEPALGLNIHLIQFIRVIHSVPLVVFNFQLVKINAEKSPYLVEKLNVFMMPTLVLIKDGQTVHHIRGFDEFGGTDSFTTEAFAYVLSTYKVSQAAGEDSMQASLLVVWEGGMGR